jgi:glutathione peroxidase
MNMTIYDYSVKAMDGSMVSLEQYKGKVLLIVNTATGCGFTPQYDGLQDLYEKYQSQGLEILDFPCNQFLGQAPGSNEEIHTFCKGRFGITFPQFAKINVNGKDEDPLYTYLKSQAKGKLGNAIKWNFTKFLVGRDGTVLARFAPADAPAAIEKNIAEALNA